MRERLRTFFFGERLKDSELTRQKLGVLWGVPVFANDTISTVSYAGEEILMVLTPVLGTAAYGKFVPIVSALIALLVLFVISYRQTIDVYPRGGGAYTVAMDNVSEKAGLLAGASLVIGYILAVAVSVSAAAAAITSAFSATEPYKTGIAILIILLMSWVHLRGTRDSALLFGIPTYLFVLTMLILIVVGFINWFTGNYIQLQAPAVPDSMTEALIFVTLRAFASGCTALAGVESVANGVSSFRAPAQRTAKRVLLAMTLIVGVIFLGSSVLISLYHVVPNHYETTISQLARSVFGFNSLMYYIVQMMTVLILVLAANTAFADLPHLMAMMAHDGYLPRRLIFRGSRLNYTNGILFLMLSSAVLVLVFQANQHTLLPLYASGVFISFFLNQLGMLNYWRGHRVRFWSFKAGVNLVALIATTVTLLTLILTRFLEGAWVTLLAIALLTALMIAIRNHYRAVAEDLRFNDLEEARGMLSMTRSGKAILPVRTLNRAFIKAFNCTQDIGFAEIELYHVGSSEAEALELKKQIDELGLQCTFTYEITEYRNTEELLIQHIEKEHKRLKHHEHLTVVIPYFVVVNPLKQSLHNETSFALLRRLSRYRYVYLFQVPYLI